MPIEERLFSLISWMTAGLDIVAGLCLAIPALRLSGHHRSVERLGLARPKSPGLEAIRDWMTERAEADLGRWSRRDHVLLWVGFLAFGISSVIKLAELVLA